MYNKLPWQLQTHNLLFIYCTRLILGLGMLNIVLYIICIFCIIPNMVYLSWGSGQIVRVEQVDVIPRSQQKTTPLLIQQQRVGVEAIGGAQKHRYTAGLQQFWPRASKRKTLTQTKRLIHLCSTMCALSSHLKMHHLALNYTMLDTLFEQD